jgi:hypothetical protein
MDLAMLNYETDKFVAKLNDLIKIMAHLKADLTENTLPPDRAQSFHSV